MITLREAIRKASMETGIYSKIIIKIESESEFSGLLGRALNDESINDLNVKLHKRKYIGEFHQSFVDAFIGKISSYRLNNPS